jgi:hypothetical protein
MKNRKVFRGSGMKILSEQLGLAQLSNHAQFRGPKFSKMIQFGVTDKLLQMDNRIKDHTVMFIENKYSHFPQLDVVDWTHLRSRPSGGESYV